MPQMRAVMSGGSVYLRPAQERLVEARRLEDVELDRLDHAVLDLDVHAALALDAGEHAHLEDLAAILELVRHFAAPCFDGADDFSRRLDSALKASDSALKVR